MWGNVPAFDVLKLASNEGEAYSKDLRLLFAGKPMHARITSCPELILLPTASGDLRHVVRTIADLPSGYTQSLEITINDRDFDIVARNVILLLIALVVEDHDKAVECIIHVWYSTLVRESDIEILQNQIQPLVQDVCEKITHKSPETLLGKTWSFGSRSLRVVLTQSTWNGLLSFFNKPANLTGERAQAIRATNTLAPSRRDYRDRYLSCVPSSQRIPFNKFRQDGLLLPFGFPRHEFTEPNP